MENLAGIEKLELTEREKSLYKIFKEITNDDNRLTKEQLDNSSMLVSRRGGFREGWHSLFEKRLIIKSMPGKYYLNSYFYRKTEDPYKSVAYYDPFFFIGYYEYFSNIATPERYWENRALAL